MPKIEIDVPVEFVQDFGGADNAAKLLRVAAAMGLYRRVAISSGYAAKLVGVTRMGFMKLLGAWHIPGIGMDMTGEDLDGDGAVLRGERRPETCDVCHIKRYSDELMSTVRDASAVCGVPEGCIEDHVRHCKDKPSCVEGAKTLDTIKSWWDKQIPRLAKPGVSKHDAVRIEAGERVLAEDPSKVSAAARMDRLAEAIRGIQSTDALGTEELEARLWKEYNALKETLK